MKVDLNKGAYIQIGGELGKYNSLPVDLLAKLANDLQGLILSIAKHTLPSNEHINLENFKLELIGFEKGSAVPGFSYSDRVENKSSFNWEAHRNSVNDTFNEVLQIGDKGNYYELRNLLPIPDARNPIVEKLYAFTSNFKDSPVSFIDYNKDSKKIIPIFKLSKFKIEIKKELITQISDTDTSEDKSVREVSGIIRETQRGEKTNSKIIKKFPDPYYSIGYAPDKIIIDDMTYNLRYPLRTSFKKEDDYFVIQSEVYDIIGTGLTEVEAEKSFAEEFDYIYQKLNSLNDNQLTEHNKLIKININHLVLNVEK